MNQAAPSDAAPPAPAPASAPDPNLPAGAGPPSTGGRPLSPPGGGMAGGWLLALASLVVNVWWACSIPYGDAPDEPQHLDVVRFIARHGEIPRLEMPDPSRPDRLRYTVHGGSFAARPPLIYAAMAAAVAIGERVDGARPDILWARWVNAVVGAATVFSCFVMTWTLFRGTPFLVFGPPLLLCFWPEHAFISGYVNNDAFAALVGTLALTAMATVLMRGWSWRRALGLGAACGLLFWTKPSGLAVLAAAPALLLFTARGCWRRVLPRAGLAVLAAALVAAPWTLFYHHEYGGFLVGGERLTEIALARAQEAHKPGNFPIRAAQGIGMLNLLEDPAFRETLTRSFFATFGWLNVDAPEQAYAAAAFLGRVAAVGVCVWLARLLVAISVAGEGGAGRLRAARGLQAFGLLALVSAASLAATLYGCAHLGYHPHGRYLFPAVAPILTLATAGAGVFLPARWQGAALAPWGITWAALNVWLLVASLLPTWSRPPVPGL